MFDKYFLSKRVPGNLLETAANVNGSCVPLIKLLCLLYECVWSLELFSLDCRQLNIGLL